jgi:hypothetical protein
LPWWTGVRHAAWVVERGKRSGVEMMEVVDEGGV